MGLHTGEAVKDSDDFHERFAVLASRITDQAAGGQILVSSLLKQRTEGADPDWSGRFEQDAHSELKWLDGTHQVYQVVWE